MKMIPPVAVTDAILTSSNVTENDYDAWDSGTTYSAGEFAILTSTHKIYESAAGSNLNNDPSTDDGTWWTEIGYTNRWRVFDDKIASVTSRAGPITYTLTMNQFVDAIAFFGLNAPQVRVQIYDDASPANEVYDTAEELVDTSEIIDWYTYFTIELESYEPTVMFTGFTCFPNYQIVITIGDGTGTPECGEIAIGRVVTLGDTLEGTEIGMDSFSRKEQDEYGDWVIVPRSKSDPTDFLFAITPSNAGRVRSRLAARRDLATVYFADESLISYGAIAYGYFEKFRIPLSYQGKSIVRLEIQALT